ncbi:MAG: putative zinc-binding metallopeptidase [Cruoricaptor ignavus]|nr:putative zinc-binding metallopeptidase [Cruoricaptor ignavus]
MKYIIILSALFLFSACSERDNLDSQSVVLPSVELPNSTDNWIVENLALPYGIDAKYRWSKNAAPNAYLSPPEEKNVLPVLETIKQLWIDLYDDARLGNSGFVKGNAPREIYLYSGRNINNRGVEVIATEGSPVKMSIYNVDTFDPKDATEVKRLMRSVHHAYARNLINHKPYDRTVFAKISPEWYMDWESEITHATNIDIYSAFFHGAYRFGGFSFPSRKNIDDDFCEIVSIMLTHTKTDIDNMIAAAGRPNNSSDADEVARALKAEQTLKTKRDFVIKYFKDEWRIDLQRAQNISYLNTQKFLN